MIETRFVKTKAPRKNAVIWAFIEEGVLERDLNLYYGLERSRTTIEKITLELAKQTPAWRDETYKAWEREEGGRHQTYNLGNIPHTN